MNKQKIQQSFFKSLMMGLIYPAILGNIMYALLTVLSDSPNNYGGLYNYKLKLAVLIVTSIFYLCDYLYSYFTYQFKTWMFFLDLLFVGLLFFTYLNMHVSSEVMNRPHLMNILLFYLIFITMYYVWDNIEIKNCKDVNEQKMYQFNIKWEVGSFLLLICNLVIHFIGNRITTETKDLIAVASISLITLCFVGINIWKYECWLLHEVTKQQTNLIQ